MGINRAFLRHSGVLRFCLNLLGLLYNRKIPQSVSSTCSLTSVIHYWLLKGCAQNMAPGAGASWLKWKTDATAASKHSQRVLLHGLQGQQAVCGGCCVWTAVLGDYSPQKLASPLPHRGKLAASLFLSPSAMGGDKMATSLPLPSATLLCPTGKVTALLPCRPHPSCWWQGRRCQYDY